MAWQRLALRVPMRPKPTISTVLPNRSTGTAVIRLFHWLACTMALSSAPRLASVIIMNIACSATEGELAVPATISGIFFLVSAGTSTAS